MDIYLIFLFRKIDGKETMTPRSRIQIPRCSSVLTVSMYMHARFGTMLCHERLAPAPLYPSLGHLYLAYDNPGSSTGNAQVVSIPNCRWPSGLDPSRFNHSAILGDYRGIAVCSLPDLAQRPWRSCSRISLLCQKTGARRLWEPMVRGWSDGS